VAKKKDWIDDLIAKGAYVRPRQIQPAVAPAVDITESSSTGISGEIAPEISLDSAVTQLEKQRHNPDPKKTTPDNHTTEYSEEIVGPELKVGDVLDLIVVSWSLIDPRGLNRPGQGLARPHGVREKGRRDGFYFNQASVISEGVETLRPGSRIRGRLAEAISSAHPFTVVDIEIYKS
jgi:hypothetical protein